MRKNRTGFLRNTASSWSVDRHRHDVSFCIARGPGMGRSTLATWLQGDERAMIKTKQDILGLLDRNRSHLRALGVRKIGLFGSFLRGDQHPDSDIDLLVEFEPGEKTFDNFMELSFFLEEILRRRIELVTLESLSPHIGPHILEEVEYAGLAA